MLNYDEIAGKLVQALLVWRGQGGPQSISISEATRIASQKNPGISESDMRAIVASNITLDIQDENIVLSRDLIDLM